VTARVTPGRHGGTGSLQVRGGDGEAALPMRHGAGLPADVTGALPAGAVLAAFAGAVAPAGGGDLRAAPRRAARP
jgi:hypothetical protein